jgi:hypothetical protein
MLPTLAITVLPTSIFVGDDAVIAGKGADIFLEKHQAI